MAMAYSKISYEHREILLKDRPTSLYDLSKKGTVPVLQLMDGTVIDESIDIMKWCIQQNDLNGWYKDDPRISLSGFVFAPSLNVDVNAE